MSKDRKPWQQCIGSRPHMIEETRIDAGYNMRDSYEVINGIAVIDVAGVLVNDEDWWDGYGCSTYHRISGEVRGAAEDPQIHGILLRVNSPGGETDMAFETADEIVAAGKKKPCWAVSDTAAFSAGYLLASAADRIYLAPKSGGVGSIGVYALHMDMSEYLAQLGIKPTFIEEGKGKTEGHPYKPLSDAGREKIAAEVGRLYDLFVEHVAARRGMEENAVRAMGAALAYAQDAITMGLADRAGTFETALGEFRAFLDNRRQQQFSVAASAVATSTEETQMKEPKADAQEAAASEQVEEKATEATETAQSEAAVETQAAAGALSSFEEIAAPQIEAARSEAYEHAAEIASLCITAGKPDMAAAFIRERKSVDTARKEVMQARAAETDADSVSSHAEARPAGADPYKPLAEARAKEKGIPFHAAYEAVVKENPQLYEQFLATRQAIQK
jgi:signal peptide peptidase SppA